MGRVKPEGIGACPRGRRGETTTGAKALSHFRPLTPRCSAALPPRSGCLLRARRADSWGGCPHLSYGAGGSRASVESIRRLADRSVRAPRACSICRERSLDRSAPNPAPTLERATPNIFRRETANSRSTTGSRSKARPQKSPGRSADVCGYRCQRGNRQKDKTRPKQQ
jgi:hypothetical protein